MQDVTLVFWTITIGGGLYMAGILLRTGRTTSSATGTRLPVGVVFGHGALAAVTVVLAILVALGLGR